MKSHLTSRDETRGPAGAMAPLSSKKKKGKKKIILLALTNNFLFMALDSVHKNF
jgi:hypothetical protein